MKFTGTIKIGSAECAVADIKESWVNEHLGHRQAESANTCVRISLHGPGVNIGLATPACGGGSEGGEWNPSPTDLRIWELWKKHGLNQRGHPRGQLIAFLHDLKRL